MYSIRSLELLDFDTLLAVLGLEGLHTVSKSNSSKLRMQYNTYREKDYSLPSEERNGNAMNMQEYIWNSIDQTRGIMSMILKIQGI